MKSALRVSEGCGLSVLSAIASSFPALGRERHHQVDHEEGDEQHVNGNVQE